MVEPVSGADEGGGSLIGTPVTAEVEPCTRNLLILHTPRLQDIADWQTVKDKIALRAPDIEVRIDSNLQPGSDTRRWQVTRPSVVFSPFRLVAYEPLGGTIYAGRDLGKGMQGLRMRALGLPTPATVRLAPGLRLDPERWGEHVIVKPTHGCLGRGVRLVRTNELEQRYAELSQDGRQPMLVQQYVDHVDAEGRPHLYRVLTIFGQPLYSAEVRWDEPRKSLAEIAADPDGKIASNSQGVGRRLKLVALRDVLALAERAAAAFPEIPCLGQDIVRRTGTNQLFVLEANPAGYSWHLSSDLGRDFTRRAKIDPNLETAMYEQFGALDVVAEQLIAKTRLSAS
ncbi:MAG: hypothetical protein U1E53_14150 [Dongiaceae bacterium]